MLGKSPVWCFLQLHIWANLQVWRQAATQVFFALGLGYGSVIAYSSYNPVHNNCHRDALMVSGINFMTSVLASLVVFVVLGFRAKNIATRCVAEYVRLQTHDAAENHSRSCPHQFLLFEPCRNLGLVNILMSHGSRQNWWPPFNVTDPGSVSVDEYRTWYSHYSSTVGPNITDCSLEEEMNKVRLDIYNWRLSRLVEKHLHSCEI